MMEFVIGGPLLGQDAVCELILRSLPQWFGIEEAVVHLKEVPVSRYLIRRIRMAHCARGPELCEQCRALDREAPALLDIDPPNPGMVARRVIEVQVDGQSAWREYDVVQTFESEDEAWAYAAAHGVGDIEL